MDANVVSAAEAFITPVSRRKRTAYVQIFFIKVHSYCYEMDRNDKNMVMESVVLGLKAGVDKYDPVMVVFEYSCVSFATWLFPLLLTCLGMLK